MTTRKNLTVASSLFLVLSAAPSSALVVMISDLVPAGSTLEDFITSNFSNIPEIRHADYANSSSGSLDALNSTRTLIAGNETTVTAAGAEVLGVAAGTYDFLIASHFAESIGETHCKSIRVN